MNAFRVLAVGGVVLLSSLSLMMMGTGCETGIEGGSSALTAKFGGIGAATAISPTAVSVSWTPQTGYTKYAIYSSSQDSPVTELLTGSSYIVKGLLPNTTYSFAVVGTSPEGNQFGVAKEAQATTLTNFLGPTTAAAVDSQSVALTWSSPPGPNFQIYVAEGVKPTIATGVPPTLVAPQHTTSSNTGYTVGGLKPSTTYYFMAVAKYQDSTDSYKNSQDVLGTATASYVNTTGLILLPSLTMQALVTSSTPPIFNIGGGLPTYRTDFAIFDNTTFTIGPTIASIMGNGSVVSTVNFDLGLQTVVATVTDIFAGNTASAEFDSIQVVTTLPNNGLRVVSAVTASGLSPIPTIATNAFSLGPFPSFTVSGAQPGYITTIYNPATNPPTSVGQITGNGVIKTNGSSPLPQGLNTLYATVTYGGATATINNIVVRVKSIDKFPVPAPVTVNNGIGRQGFGRTLATGDFNCDGRPDLAVGAPYGNGVWVYYGTASGLDFTASPSTTSNGTKPLYIPSPTNWLTYGSGYSPAGDGVKWGMNLAVSNFNGDYSDSPVNQKPCSDLAISVSGAFGPGPMGVIAVYYGAPTGLQTGTLSENAFTCLGAGSSSCTPSYYNWATAGIPLGSASPLVQYYFDGMGHSMAAGDIDGDGYDDLVGGAPNADGDIAYAHGGILLMWRGTPNGISPSFQKITLPLLMRQNAGAAVAAKFGMQLAIGHFVTSAKGSGGPADIAASFIRLSPTTPGLTNATSQSGIMIIPGSAAAPYIAVDGSNNITTNYLVTPPQCSSAVVGATLTPPAPAGWIPYQYCAGAANSLVGMDINKDDYDDLIFSNPMVGVPGGGTGAVFIYFGGSNIGQFITQGAQSTIPLSSNTCAGQPCTTPQVFYRGSTSISRFGLSLSNLGDTNGDTYPDLGIGAIPVVPGLGNQGNAYVYRGSATGLTSAGSTTVSPAKDVNSFFGTALAGGSWKSATGYYDFQTGAATFNDLAVGAAGDSPANRLNGVMIASGIGITGGQAQGTVNLISNQSPGLPSLINSVQTVLAADNTTLSGLGSDFATLLGDINGDGFADIAVRITLPSSFNYLYGPDSPGLQPQSQMGFVIYYGSSTGFITTKTVAGVTTPTAPSYNPVSAGDPLLVTNSLIRSTTGGFNSPNFANTVTAAGDMNGDTYQDVVTSYAYESNAVLFYGSPTGLIVAPSPRAIPYDQVNRPSLDPIIIMADYYQLSTSNAYNAGDGFKFYTHGDFNGDGFGDFVFTGVARGDITVIYGSSLGPVTDGTVWDSAYYPAQYAVAPSTNRAQSAPTCSGIPLVCTPLWIPITVNNGLCGAMNGGDMDGDGTDDLVSVNCNDANWGYRPAPYDKAGTVSIYYGSQTNGLNPNLYVNLRIATKTPFNNRFLGGADGAWSAGFNGGFGRAFDLNGDALGDIALSSLAEATAYVIYGVPGPGTSPTTNSGAYIQQGLCASFPCNLDVTFVATADYAPNHITDITTSNPNSCSAALRSCNIMRFPLLSGVSAWSTHGIFGMGDITGDAFGELIVSDNYMATSPYTSWGKLWIYSGSANGLQVAGTPTDKPTCVNGVCGPMSYNIPVTLPNLVNSPTVVGGFYATALSNPSDVDGDGKRDFLIGSAGLNSFDHLGNKNGNQTGGFFLFH